MSMLLFIGTCEGILGCTMTQHGACAQFITVFLGSFIAGSVLNQARALINNPTMIFSTLGTAAPLTSIFFLTWIELNVSALPSCNGQACHVIVSVNAAAVWQCIESVNQRRCASACPHALASNHLQRPSLHVPDAGPGSSSCGLSKNHRLCSVLAHVQTGCH